MKFTQNTSLAKPASYLKRYPKGALFPVKEENDKFKEEVYDNIINYTNLNKKNPIIESSFNSIVDGNITEDFLKKFSSKKNLNKLSNRLKMPVVPVNPVEPVCPVAP